MIIEVATLLSLINIWRFQQGLSVWNTNPELETIAFARWQEMCADDYFAHTDDRGHNWALAVQNSHYDYQIIAENLALGQNDAKEVLTAWLASPEHRATVGGDYFEVGLYSGACQIQGREQNLTVAIAAQPHIVDDQKLFAFSDLWQRLLHRS